MSFLKKKSVSIISFFFNESENIQSFYKNAMFLLKDCEKSGIKLEFILIDDGSTDGSYEKFKKIIKSKKIRLFKNNQNKGVPYSFEKGIRLAKNSIIFHQTIDWSYDLSNFKRWFFLLKKYDAVIGFREINKTRSDNLKKTIISYVNYYFIKTLFPSNIKDYQNLFFFKKEDIKNIKFISPFVTCKIYLNLYKKNKKVIQVPINFIKRKKGESKGTDLRFILDQIKDILFFWFKKGWKISYNLYFKKKFKVETFKDQKL